tara:strand:- start:2733 stop:2891 length:159 start_codon:yes stop_codon:yes gene_type:complete
MWILGGAEEDRTPDLFNAIEALSQLSYSPVSDTIYLFFADCKSVCNTVFPSN